MNTDTSPLRRHPLEGIRSVEELLQLPYFELLACLTSGSLHPGGGAATQLLLDECRLHPSDRVLEVGCGPGWTTRALLRAGIDVTVVERSPRMLDAMLYHCAQEQLPAPRCTNARVEDFTAAEGARGGFDVAILECVVGFVDNKPKMVESLMRQLALGGRIGVLDVHYVRVPPQAMLDEVKRVTGHAIPPMMRGDWESLFGRMKKLVFKEFQLPDASGDSGRRVVAASGIQARMPQLPEADLQRLERYLDDAGAVFKENKSYMQGHLAVWELL